MWGHKRGERTEYCKQLQYNITPLHGPGPSPSMLVSAEIELIFFLLASTALCFGFSMRQVSVRWVSHAAMVSRCTRSREAAKTGQLTRTGQRDNPYHWMWRSVYKPGGQLARSCQLLLRDRLGIGQQVLSWLHSASHDSLWFSSSYPSLVTQVSACPRAHHADPASARRPHRTPGNGTTLPRAGAGAPAAGGELRRCPAKRKSGESSPYLPSRCPGAPSSEAAMVPAAGRGRPAAAPRPSPSRGTRCPRAGARRRSPVRRTRGPGRHPALGRNSPTCWGRAARALMGGRSAAERSGAGGPREAGRARARPGPALSVSPPRSAAMAAPAPSRGSLETAFPKAPYSLRLHLHGNERGEVTVAGPRLQLQQERPAATGASRHAVHTHVYTREGWKSYRRNFKFNPIKLSLQHDHIIVWLGLLNETMIVQKKYIFIYNLCMMW